MAFFKRIVYWVETFLTWLAEVFLHQKFDRHLYRFNVPEVWYSPWNIDDAFTTLHAAISGNTLVSKRKLYDLFSLGKQFDRLGGNFLEVGTLRGGTAALLASIFTGRQLVLWDNWGDHVEHDDYLVKKIYSESDDLNKTKQLLERVAPRTLKRCIFINKPFPCENDIEGWDSSFALIHFDIYDKSAFEVGIEYLWPQVQQGGIFIVSAYGSISLEPLNNSVNAFVKKQKDCLFIQSQSGLGLLIKI